MGRQALEECYLQQRKEREVNTKSNSKKRNKHYVKDVEFIMNSQLLKRRKESRNENIGVDCSSSEYETTSNLDSHYQNHFQNVQDALCGRLQSDNILLSTNCASN